MPQQLQSPEIQAWTIGFPLSLFHVALTLALLAAGAALHSLITPHREVRLIREGNPAAALSFGGMLVGLAIPLAASLAASRSAIEILLWGGAKVFVQLALFRLTDLLLHGLPQRIAEGEVPAAALLIAARTSTAVILAAALTVQG
ncbi:MAG: DUF350 domain-containing protein [Caulobacteraceae bacterium]